MIESWMRAGSLLSAEESRFLTAEAVRNDNLSGNLET